uniref:DC1 domain-containing protein n=1 Tax=Populus alba TaxID=43335 RepID=A0A4U5NK92_POPAL|nr:hypothetical protein D5086_0000266380 [Populus alba]
MPCLAIPFSDTETCKRLKEVLMGRFHVMVVSEPSGNMDGKTLNPNVAEVIEDHGLEVYPFTPEKLDELAVMDEAKLEAGYGIWDLGSGWSFCCKRCEFDLHPKCALKEDENTGTQKGKDGFAMEMSAAKLKLT